MSNEQFSLCWDNFHKNMSSGMNSMLESEDLVDVTLAIEGQYLKAHKMILSVCSPYFRTLFSVNPCKHPIVFMKDISYVVMNDLLTFMYQGEVQVNQENLATFIKTAEALQIKGLTGDNNDVDDVVQETQTKRPAPTEEPKMRTIKKQCVQIPTKKTKLTPPTAETEIIVPPSITSTESKPELFVSVSNTNNDAVDFKMEPYDSMHDDEANDSNFDDGQTSEYIEEGIDGGKDYIMEGEEEPQAGTSGDGLADSQDVRTVRASGKFCRGERKPEMPRYIVDGFVFHVNIIKGTPPMTYLRCLEYKRLGCHARAVIPFNGTINDIKLKKGHNHPPDYAAEEKIVFLRELKDVTLKNNTDSTKEVYDMLSPLYPNAARETTYSLIKSKMKRWRRIGAKPAEIIHITETNSSEEV